VRTVRLYDAAVLTWLKSPVLVIVATQLLFTTGDLIARANMRHSPFTLSTFLSWWFLVYFLIRQVAMFGQLYALSALQIGKTMALFSATSIVVVNVLGILLLGEVLSTQAYLAIALVVFAFILLSMSP
jgi:multidrug transporter EmrE-like cation transporter